MIKSKIKDFAADLGFCKFAIAKATPLIEELEHNKQYFYLNYNASMLFLEKNLSKRINIEEVLPNAKTIIVVAQNYFYPRPNEKKCFEIKDKVNENKSSGLISRYAWGDDYHEIIKNKLSLLSEKIVELLPGTVNKFYCDTGPISEKQWAIRAGIGWQGKNGLIITKEFGSWIFLGIIITTAELDPDEPAKDLCGTCKKCVEACPTKAITEHGLIDSRKCISYWTGEANRKIEIPDDIARNMNGRLYGCEICQEVCPWNRFAKITEDKQFYPRNEQTNLDLNWVINLTEDDFIIHFKNSSIFRIKLDGLKKNARALMKNFE